MHFSGDDYAGVKRLLGRNQFISLVASITKAQRHLYDGGTPHPSLSA